MEMKRSTLNILTNVASSVLTVVTGLVLVPFLVRQFGVETYGLWALIAATTGYFLILDFGLTAAVGRLIAGCRTSEDIARLNTLISTATVLFVAVCTLVCVATLAVSIVFFHVFHVPDAQMTDVHHSLITLGLSVGVYMLGAPFSSMLWGYERFDLTNSVDFPVLLMRTVMTFWLFRGGGSLLELSALTLLGNLVSALLYLVQCQRLEPRLSVKLSHFSWAIVKKLFHFGIYFSFLNTMRTLTSQIGTVIVGHDLSNRLVTTFSIPRQLTVYSNNFVLSATAVAVARAAVLHFSEETDRQRKLFIEGGRYATALSCFFAIGFFTLGAPFLALWQRGLLDDAYSPLIILTLGEIIPMSQWVTYGIVTSMGKHRRLGVFAVFEGAAIIALAPVLTGHFGLLGICAAVSFAGFIFRGLCQWLYGCKLLEIRPLTYVKKVFLPVVTPSLLQLVLFSPVGVWFALSSWRQLVLAGTIYSLTYILLLYPFLFGWRELPQHARILLRRIRSRVV